MKFKVAVVDEYQNERSKVHTKTLFPDTFLLNLMVDCTGNDVRANWRLTSYPYNVDEYCLKYKCDSENKEIETVGCKCFVYS